MNTRRIIGLGAEKIADKYLIRQGLLIIDHNVVYPFGELDLVAKDGSVLVFVEVKYRKNITYGAPFEAVTMAKQRKIIKAAQAYLQQQRGNPLCRFDVISLYGDLAAPQIEHIKDAFWVEEHNAY